MKLEHNGVSYTKLYINDSEVKGHVAVGETKLIIDGGFAISLTKGSYKHGDEIQFNIFHEKGKSKIVKKKRNKSKYNSVEIMIPAKYLSQVYKFMRDAKK